MKIKKALLSVLLAGCISTTLVGCGGGNDTAEEDNSTQTEQKAESKPKVTENKKKKEKTEEKKDDAVGKVETTQGGTRTTLKSMKGLNIEQVQGPIRAKITDIQMGKLETTESSKKMFNDKDLVYFMTIAMEVENTSADTISIYPDQGTLVTDTKEQIDANVFLSGAKLGGEYMGNVIQKGNVIFIMDSNPEDIHNVKFTFKGAHNSNFDEVSGDFTFDLNIQ